MDVTYTLTAYAENETGKSKGGFKGIHIQERGRHDRAGGV